MLNGFYTKDDIVDVRDTNTNMTQYDVKITTEIMQGVTSRIGLIEAIEAYNEDHKLPYNKRIQYTIAVSNNYIAVLKAYRLEENGNELCVIGWDQNGYPAITYNDKGSIESAKAGLSTHIINIDNINDVVIGNYDATKIGNIFDFNTVDEISEKELIKKLSATIDSVTTLVCSGSYRSAFSKFTYDFNRNNFNDYTYEHKNTAYSLYIRLYTKYILLLKDIVLDSMNPGRIEYTDNTIVIKTHNRFEFIDSLDDIDELMKFYYYDIYDSPEYKNNYEANKHALLEKTFTTAELNTFKELIAFDNLRLDNQGNPYWIEDEISEETKDDGEGTLVP